MKETPCLLAGLSLLAAIVCMCNNDTVSPEDTVVDTEKPVITFIGGDTVLLKRRDADPITLSDVSAYYDVDGDITDSIQLPSIPIAQCSTFKVIYQVSDRAGNAAQKARTIIIDGNAPVITLAGDNPMHLSVGGSYEEPGAAATDAVDGVISDRIIKVVKNAGGTVVSLATFTNAIGAYTITYSVSDQAGNAADPMVRNVYVRDTIVDTGNMFNKYGIPLATALATINKVYNFGAMTDGIGAPNVSNISTFTLNWNLPNKGLFQFAFNTSNGVPSYYVNLSPTNTFASASPGFTLSASGITGLDGDYYITADATQCVWVKKDGSFAIVFK